MGGGDVEVCPLSFDNLLQLVNELSLSECDRKGSLFVGNDADECMWHFEDGKWRVEAEEAKFKS